MNVNFFDFPEDGFAEGQEFRIKDRLLKNLMGLARPLVAASMQDLDSAFYPRYGEAVDKWGERIGDMLWINCLDWLLFDHPIDPENGKTITELLLHRKKLDLPVREKEILAMMRDAEMDLYEIRNVHPGRGLELKRLADSREFQAVEMKASRQLSRWTILACRLWLLDGVHRLSGSMYIFEPEKRAFLEKTIHTLAGSGIMNDKSRRTFRSRFSPEMCRLWLDPLFSQKMPKLRNRDGDQLLFCRALFRIEDANAVQRKLAGQREILTREEDEGTIAWLSHERDETGGQTVLGIFRLKDDGLEFEANSLKRYQKGMSALKKILGKTIRLKEEEKLPMEEMLERMPKKPPEYEEPLAEKQAELIRRVKREHYRNWPDRKLPARNGLTPRQAVRSAAGRRAVALLLKQFESGEAENRLRGDPAVDIAFLWDSLKLDPKDY